MSTALESLEEQSSPPAAEPAERPSPPDDQPVTVIERRPGWHLIDMRELWRARELLFFLTWRDIKVRYKQTVLGVAWSVMQPLATMFAFSLFLGKVGAAEDAAVPYALYVFAGLLPWSFFASAVNGASTSVVGSQHVITKIYFPRLLVPFGSVLASLVDFFIAFALLFILMPFFGILPGLSFLLLPVVVTVLLALAVGLGTLLSALTVAYRDFRAIVPLALQLWMFVTPALFLQNLGILGPRMYAWLPLNPLHGILVNFRAATLGSDLDLPALSVSALWALGFLLLGCFYFRRVERGFADII